MSDISIIEKLNKKLPRPLKELKKISWITKGYVLNDKQQLTHLSIFKCRLKGEIPEEVFQLQHLAYLDIRENSIAEIPEQIKNLKQLRYLDIRINAINKLPVAFAELSKLERLYLGQNRFANIPQEVEGLSGLNLIDFSENSISKGCESLLKAEQLKNIYLNNNQLTSFPFEMLIANQLDELVLLDIPLDEYSGTTRDKIGRLVL